MTLYFRTKEFEEEYKSKNDKVVGVLKNEFKIILDDVDKSRKSASSESEIDRIEPHIERLAKKGGEIVDWNHHIDDGRNNLKTSGRYIFIGSLMMAVAFGLYSALSYVPALAAGIIVAVYVALLALLLAGQQFMSYCRLAKKIDDKMAEILKPPNKD